MIHIMFKLKRTWNKWSHISVTHILSYCKNLNHFYVTHLFHFEEDLEQMTLNEMGREKLERQNSWQLFQQGYAVTYSRIKISELWQSPNENFTNDIPLEKHGDWPPCFAHKLNHSNRMKDGWTPKVTFCQPHIARSRWTSRHPHQSRHIPHSPHKHSK